MVVVMSLGILGAALYVSVFSHSDGDGEDGDCDGDGDGGDDDGGGDERNL